MGLYSCHTGPAQGHEEHEAFLAYAPHIVTLRTGTGNHNTVQFLCDWLDARNNVMVSQNLTLYNNRPVEQLWTTSFYFSDKHEAIMFQLTFG